ncbi:hypothetical protein [Pseudarthrobacter sp. fls2-241-R2A-127]|uniref:hypothetical protein n=1 Tax=Pseudarthrobacter sp. fls2-241-R2A-127 TaxID=3040303 RepID=UPI0025542231|nr:hypothetical protein [Pseudarthrobacter sp. fls2-241-R2A-127]
MIPLNLFPLSVVPSIKLHNQPAVQQQINVPNPFQVHLRLDMDAGLAEVRPGERFQKRIRPAVHPPQDSPGLPVPVPRQALTQEFEGISPRDTAHSTMPSDSGKGRQRSA